MLFFFFVVFYYINNWLLFRCSAQKCHAYLSVRSTVFRSTFSVLNRPPQSSTVENPCKSASPHPYRTRSRFSRHREAQRVLVAPPFRVRSQQHGLDPAVTAAALFRVANRVARVVRTDRRLEQRYAQRRDARTHVRRLGQMEQIEFGARQPSDRVHSHDLSVRRLDPNARVCAVAQHCGYVILVRAVVDKKKKKK